MKKIFILRDAIKWWTKNNTGHFNSDLYFKILLIRTKYEEIK